MTFDNTPFLFYILTIRRNKTETIFLWGCIKEQERDLSTVARTKIRKKKAVTEIKLCLAQSLIKSQNSGRRNVPPMHRIDGLEDSRNMRQTMAKQHQVMKDLLAFCRQAINVLVVFIINDCQNQNNQKWVDQCYEWLHNDLLAFSSRACTMLNNRRDDLCLK